MTKTVERTSPYPKRTPLKVFPIFNFKSDPEFTITKKSPGRVAKKSRSKKAKIQPKSSAHKSDEQYFIDAGQHDFDGTRCKTCNMLYSKGEYEDEEHHAKYHDNFINSIKYKPWKGETTVKKFDEESKIILIRPSDPKHMLKKVDELFTIADLELGINVGLFDCIKPDMAFLLYIHEGKRIAGFVAAEKITEANEYNPDTGMINIADSVPCEIGVSRIWIHANYRRKGIGTHLLDALRDVFKKENFVNRTSIAFTDPTEEGQEFIFKYTGIKKILVYTVAM